MGGRALLAPIIELLDTNLARVENLTNLYGPPRRGRRKVNETDVLRAALVLLHASMEDFLRSLLAWRAPLGTKDQIDSYPLAGSGSKNPDKFQLGSLAAYRGKTVDELIALSINEYLEQFSSFNDLGEVKKSLVVCGVPRATVEATDFGELPAMIARRHKIVHKADRNEVQAGQGNHRTASIGLASLINYLAAVRSLRDFVGQHL
jgi:hypothetical protein